MVSIDDSTSASSISWLSSIASSSSSVSGPRELLYFRNTWERMRIISTYTRVRTLIMVLWRASAMISRRVQFKTRRREDRDGHRVTRIASLLPLAVTQTKLLLQLSFYLSALRPDFWASWFRSLAAPSPALPNL